MGEIAVGEATKSKGWISHAQDVHVCHLFGGIMRQHSAVAALFPPPLHKRVSVNACLSTSVDTPYRFYDDAVCSTACGGQCFPRVRRMCVGYSSVTLCKEKNHVRGKAITGTPIPSHMEFPGADSVKRRKLPVKRRDCATQEKDWIKGTQMVADVKMMPSGRHYGPNPHHEAEKILPAILLSHLYGLNESSLFWFTDPLPRVTSRWSIGLLDAFADGLKVAFLSLPKPGEPEICFDDAILFSGVTNAGYMPGVAANDWLRHRVLRHCNIVEHNATRPLKDVIVLNRSNSSRTIANLDDVERVLERELKVQVRHNTSGLGNFCDQAKLVAEADFVLTPHGSHNINFLFARPNSVVMEVFPLLYYIDWFHNYIHASRVNHFELYGTWPTDKGGMPLRMRIYAVLAGWRNCFSIRQCMNYTKTQKIYVDVDQLEWLLHALITSCKVSVKGSWCQSGAARKTALVP